MSLAAETGRYRTFVIPVAKLNIPITFKQAILHWSIISRWIISVHPILNYGDVVGRMT